MIKSVASYKLVGSYRVKQFSTRIGHRFEELLYKTKFLNDDNSYSLGLGSVLVILFWR
jgi:hypothetical protein